MNNALPDEDQARIEMERVGNATMICAIESVNTIATLFDEAEAFVKTLVARPRQASQASQWTGSWRQ
jgi:hypothetical protein